MTLSTYTTVTTTDRMHTLGPSNRSKNGVNNTGVLKFEDIELNEIDTVSLKGRPLTKQSKKISCQAIITLLNTLSS